MGSWQGVELDDLVLAEPGGGSAPAPLQLRPWQPTDVPVVHAAMQDRSMHRWLPLPDPYTEDDARAFCLGLAPGRAAAGRGVSLAVVGLDDVPIGGIDLVLPDSRDAGAEIGYGVYPGHRGAGVAARAVRVLAGWAFAHGVARVEIVVATGNLASVRTALAAGFRFEAVRRAGMELRASPVDVAAFVRLAVGSAASGAPVPPWLPPLRGPDGEPPGDDVVWLRPLGEPDPTADVAHDVAAVLTDHVDPEARRWLVGPAVADPDEAARRAVASAPLGWLVGPSTRVAIVDRATGATAGVIEVRGGAGAPPGVLELGYVVRPEFRGRGVTARALRLFAAWAFAGTDTGRLELGADVRNVVSQRVAERAGFTREGIAPGRLRDPAGVFRDEVRYGLVRRNRP